MDLLYPESRKFASAQVLSLLVLSMLGYGCGSSAVKPNPMDSPNSVSEASEEVPASAPETEMEESASSVEAPSPVIASEKVAVPDTRALLVQLGKRIDILETQLASMNDKLDAARLSFEKFSRSPSSVEKPKITPVASHPADGVGTDIPVVPAKNDPDSGFAQDEPIQTFRKAFILYQAQKYSEAVLTFSKFLEKFPDHPLAGSSQFYVGECYIKQKEFKLAIQEYQHVLTSYDRSPHVSDTLKQMIIAEEKLKLAQEAAKHRQLLTSLFPQSPAAKPHHDENEEREMVQPAIQSEPHPDAQTIPPIHEVLKKTQSLEGT